MAVENDSNATKMPPCGQERRHFRKLAATDSLTGVYNRRSFVDLSQHLFDQLQKERGNLALLIIDIDQFKKINSQYGHQIGDQALVQVARVLTRLSRRTDIIGRFSGDEFIILAPELALEDARPFAERIVKTVCREPICSGVLEIPLTLSIGVCSCIPDDRTLEEVIRRAELAVAHAKEAGRNRVTCGAEIEAINLISTPEPD